MLVPKLKLTLCIVPPITKVLKIQKFLKLYKIGEKTETNAIL